jgi:hypothetical protein
MSNKPPVPLGYEMPEPRQRRATLPALVVSLALICVFAVMDWRQRRKPQGFFAPTGGGVVMPTTQPSGGGIIMPATQSSE